MKSPSLMGTPGQCQRRVTAVLVLILSLALGWNWTTIAASPPNLVLILADDMGYSDLGCFGSEIPTPNLDRLASEGVRMTQFYTTPRCCPTRASLLTGLYPHQAGMGNMMEDRGIPGYRGELSTNCLTMAEELRLAGYRTLMVGKWHLNHIHFNGKKQLNGESTEPFWENKAGWPLQRGFDEYYGTIHGVCSYYDPFSLVHGNTPIKPDSTNFYYTDVITDHAVASIDRQLKLVARNGHDWKLYDVEADRTELHNLAAARPDKMKELSVLYDAWARRCQVVPPDQLPRARPTVPASD